MPFIPHTDTEIANMLNTIGVNDIEQLFLEIPEKLKQKSLLNIPMGMSENQLAHEVKLIISQDNPQQNYIGAGAYEHHIPAAVWELAGRGEFLTAYTPYQAEASQGGLQLLFEYQTMMASLMGMDVSNASMYDGATSLAEAILMAVRIKKIKGQATVLVPRNLHPLYRDVISTIVRSDLVNIIEIPFDITSGRIDESALTRYAAEGITALVIAQPNFFGCWEEVDNLVNWAHEREALVIGVVNPTAMAIGKPPGEWGKNGADICCGEGQPLGVPLASGGPYFGFMCCRKEFVRQIPGRLVGQTIDSNNQTAYALTLQAREQHIRRGKATSNICTNQGLLVTAASIYMSLLGPIGLEQVALHCHKNTRELAELLCEIPGVSQYFDTPYFHEVVIKLPKSPNKIINQLSKTNIQSGVELKPYYSELDMGLLVCVTETKTTEDLMVFKNKLQEVLC